MKRLERPIARHLDDRVDEAALARVWARTRRGRSRGLRSIAHGVAIGASLVALVALAIEAWPTATEAPAIVETPRLDPIEAHDDRVATLSDGSDLVLARGARVEPLALDRARVLLHQQRGRVEYRVAHDPERRFIVEAGRVSVEVTGTRFIVDRTIDPVGVEVLEGSVIVRGADVPDGVMRLAAGQSLPRPASDEMASLPAPEAPALAPTTAEPLRPRAPAPSAEPAAPAVDPVDAWLADADRARAEGRHRDAVPLLTRVVERGGPRGALASYTLGRLHMDELRDPAAAAGAFERALALGLPRNLQEPARYRAYRALVRHDVIRAEEAARGYLEAHPEGPHAAEVRAWLDGQ